MIYRRWNWHDKLTEQTVLVSDVNAITMFIQFTDVKDVSEYTDSYSYSEKAKHLQLFRPEKKRLVIDLESYVWAPYLHD